MKYASIILIHYSLVDDYGGRKAPASLPSRSEMLKMTVDAIVKNTDYPAELIVMDSGGNPDDSEYLLDLARKGVVSTYVRYANNMQYAFAFNQGAKLATGDYLVFTCNDVVVKPKWLSTCIGMLEKYPDKKYVASPLICSHMRKKYDWGRPDGNRVNPYAGSNCFVMTREAFKDLGDYLILGNYGNTWYKNKVKKGYPTIAPPEDLAEHLADRKGMDWKRHVKITKTLLNKEEINFDECLN